MIFSLQRLLHHPVEVPDFRSGEFVEQRNFCKDIRSGGVHLEDGLSLWRSHFPGVLSLYRHSRLPENSQLFDTINDFFVSLP